MGMYHHERPPTWLVLAMIAALLAAVISFAHALGGLERENLTCPNGFEIFYTSNEPICAIRPTREP